MNGDTLWSEGGRTGEEAFVF